MLLHIKSEENIDKFITATDEALKIRENAELYAQQVLTSLEGNLTQLQQGVKNCQIYVEQLRTDAISKYGQRH